MAIVALMLPLAIGLSFLISHYFSMTQYSTSMISLIGIAVSIDYSLFMISRFFRFGSRCHDRGRNRDHDAHSRPGYTLYSGATVAVGLCSLFYFSETHMPSMGMGAFLAVLGGPVVLLDPTTGPTVVS